MQHLDDMVRQGDQGVYLDDDLFASKSRVNSFSWVPCNILWGHTPSLVNSWFFSLIEKSVWLNPASIFLFSVYSHAFWDPWKRIELNQDFWNYFTFPHDLLHQQAHLSYGKASVPSFLSVPNEERIKSQFNINPAAVQQLAAMLLNYWINRRFQSSCQFSIKWWRVTKK